MGMEGKAWGEERRGMVNSENGRVKGRQGNGRLGNGRLEKEITEPVFANVKETRNRFRGFDSASLCSMAGPV